MSKVLTQTNSGAMPDGLILQTYPNGTHVFGGFIYDLLAHYLCPMMKLRTVAKYGDELKKPRDTAAIREMIKNNEIDTTSKPFVLSSQVLLYFDCVTLTTKADSVALVIGTSFEIHSFQWETFLKPLKWQCWIAAIALAIITSNTFKIYLNFQEKMFRILTSMYFFGIFAMYSAVLYASLTVTSTSKLYETLEDLLDDGRFQINAHKDYSIDNILK
uniref:Ionotropic glutamate receptor C-terminal domain-containing protein n=1 Tax=Strigamia maritima TaxID=126957 RepID=T1JH16_STRMM